MRRRAYSTAFLISLVLHGLLGALLAVVVIRDREQLLETFGAEVVQVPQETPKRRPPPRRPPVIPQRTATEVVPQPVPADRWQTPVVAVAPVVSTAAELPLQAGGLPAVLPEATPPKPPTIPVREVGSAAAPTVPLPSWDGIGARPIPELAPDQPLPGLSSLLLQDAARLHGAALPTPEYWETLQKRIARHRRYPRFAQEQGIEGTVLVRFVLRRDGSLERVEVARSSGYRILDEEAQETIRRAAPFPPFPPGQPGDRIAVEVPIVYRLKRP
ncbi:MAG: hypothetical protein KatS3mg115_1091 [Candidatus Poribacteria bacterium]|nr:MAG: hypothetical protein KatS3mg115_1091 [Candidatus Poribacteria bacterium]